MRGRCGRTSFGPGASRARLGRKSGVCMAVRLAVGAKGSHNQKPPPGSPRQPPSQCFPAHFCPELPGISRLLFIACLLTIAPLCGGLCAIVQYGGAVLLPLSSVRAPSAVRGRPHDERRWRQLPSPCGLLSLRRTQNDPMLRKGNVLLCTNRGTFYIALTEFESRCQTNSEMSPFLQFRNVPLRVRGLAKL